MKRKIKLIGGICLVLVLVVSLSGCGPGLALADKPQDELPPGIEKAIEPEPEAGLLPLSIIPVVIVQGSDYEMGYQYGQQAGQWIAMNKSTSSLSEKALRNLKAYQWYIKEYTPEAIDMMIGIADGATDAGYPMTYIDVLRMNASTRSYPTGYPPDAEKDKLPPKACSNWSAWGDATTDGSLICGDSWDGTFTHLVAIVAFPGEGNNYVLAAPAGCIGRQHPGMNNKGLFIGGSGGFARRPEDRGYGLPDYQCGPQHLLRFADTAEEAVYDMLLSWQTNSSTNWHISDVNGNAYVVESTAAIKSVRQAGDFGEGDFIYASNNYFNEDMYDAMRGDWEYTEFIEHGGYIGGADSMIARNLEMWDMLDKYQGKVDLDFAKMIWRHPGIPPDGTGEGISELKPINQLRYWGQICNSDNQRVTIGLPDDGNNGVMYLCAGPAGKVNYPLGGDRNFQIAGTHSFYELALAKSPYRVARAAKKAAKCSWSPTMEGGAIGNAYFELMWLNYDDPAYAPLNELFSLANAEYFEGINWYNKARAASGDEQLLYYSKALTAFTRAQAHANQVYNALVAPATNPEDLGLEVYGGDWAEWAQPSWSFGP